MCVKRFINKSSFGGADYEFSHGETFIVWILMAILVNNCLKK